MRLRRRVALSAEQSWAAPGAAVGGALGGGRGAAAGAIIGATTGAIIGAEGEARAGGYYYWHRGCYVQRPDGVWVRVPWRYCGPY